MFIYQIRRRAGCLRPQEADDFFADDPRTVAMTVETGFRHGFQFFRMHQEAGCDRYQVFLLLDPAGTTLGLHIRRIGFFLARDGTVQDHRHLDGCRFGTGQGTGLRDQQRRPAHELGNLVGIAQDIDGMAQFTAHLAQFVVQVGVVAGDDGEAVDGIEAVQQGQGLLDGPHAQAAAHDEDVLVSFMSRIPMPAVLFEGLAHGDARYDDLIGSDALFDEQVLELRSGDTIDVDLGIDPELVDGEIRNDPYQGDVEAAGASKGPPPLPGRDA